MLWCHFAEAGRDPRAQWSEVPLWKKEVSWSGNASTVGFEVYEHNNECQAIDVIGQIGQARWWRSFLRIGSLGGMRAGIAQSRWVPLVYCDHNAEKFSCRTVTAAKN